METTLGKIQTLGIERLKIAELFAEIAHFGGEDHQSDLIVKKFVEINSSQNLLVIYY